MKKRLFTIFLVLAVMFTMCFSTGVAYAAETPEGTPIYTVDDLRAMENNPSGSYYLAADIQLPENFTIFKYEYMKNNYFTGTLDGNGYKLIGYTVNHNGGWYEGAFIGGAKGATLKNLHFTDVNVNINSNSGFKAGVVVGYTPEACTLSKITLEGNVTLKGSGDYKSFTFGGVGHHTSGTLTSCYNKMNITADISTPDGTITITGLSPFVAGGPIKSCRNYGDITLNARTNGYTGVNVIGVASSLVKFSSCRNTGDITVNFLDGCKVGKTIIAGVAGDTDETMTSCYNTGKITVKNIKTSRETLVAGVVADGKTVSKCYNKGAVSLSGEVGDAYVGGVAGIGAPSKTYNKGKVSASATAELLNVGGIAGEIYKMSNCYNTGAVSMSKAGNQGMVGGLAGNAYVMGETAKYNYNTGKVTGETTFKGSIFGTYSGPEIDMERTINYNYYTSSAKAYGMSGVTWKDWTAKATKVSAITASSCPKLSTKTWTYSKDKKRLILKDNKEK